MNILVVEDEALEARKLIRFIKNYHTHYKIAQILYTIEDTVQHFRNELLPDLVFLDIHLADGNSFEIFKQITVQVPIIFVTAYDEYALHAFQVNSVGYILKPINQLQIDKSFEKYFQLKNSLQTQSFNYQQLAEMLQPQQHYKTQIPE